MRLPSVRTNMKKQDLPGCWCRVCLPEKAARKPDHPRLKPCLQDAQRLHPLRHDELRHDDSAKFKAWTAEAKKHRDACRNGEISLDAFEAWLKK